MSTPYFSALSSAARTLYRRSTEEQGRAVRQFADGRIEVDGAAGTLKGRAVTRADGKNVLRLRRVQMTIRVL
jgi:hypothetical protein